MARLAIIATLLALGACSGPSFVPNPESGVELRWENGQGDLTEAAADAASACGETRGAALDSVFTDGDETLARFYCR